MTIDKMTVIGIRTSTREKLKSEGKKGETYDQIIVKILNNLIEMKKHD